MYRSAHLSFLIYLLFSAGYAFAQCDVTVTDNKTICKGSEITLTASSQAGNDAVWTWTDDRGGIYSKQSTITVSPVVTTNYTVTADINKVGSELIKNGDFESGDVDFKSDYQKGTQTAWPGPLGPEGTYLVLKNAKDGHENFIGTKDHTPTGPGNFLVVNGSPDVTNLPNIWYQSITGIKPNTKYKFSAWLCSVNTANPAQLQFYINGQPIGNLSAPATVNTWQNFSAEWDAGATPPATITIGIKSINSDGNGNDFGLDDISFIPQNCTDTKSVKITVIEPANIDFSYKTTCAGKPVTFTNTTTPIDNNTYEWFFSDASGIETAVNPNPHNFTGMGPFKVKLKVISQATCRDSVTKEIVIPATLKVDVANFSLNCNGDKNGKLKAEITGGTADKIEWLPGSLTTELVENLAPGTYIVTVTDNNSCIATATAEVKEPPAIVINSITSTAANCGQPDGTATVIASGGTVTVSNPLTYLWKPGNITTAAATKLIAGKYTVTVTDANSCIKDTAVSVNGNTGITVEIDKIKATQCFNSCDGSVSVKVSGGTEPYQYTWAPVVVKQSSLIGLCAGSYTCNVKDANNCSSSIVVKIEQPKVIELKVTNDTTVCINQCVSLQAVAFGGEAPYTYTWPPQGQTVCPSKPASYAISVKDANGCNTSKNVSIGLKSALKLSVNDPKPICEGDSIFLKATATGGDGRHTILWLPSQQFGNSIKDKPTKTTVYTIVLKDGCTTPADTAKVIAVVNPLPIVAFEVSDTAVCASDACLDFTTNNKGILRWDFGDNTPAGTIATHHCYAEPGVYTVNLEVTENGCSSALKKDKLISIYTVPENGFTMSSDVVHVMDAEICFGDLSLNADNVHWNFGDYDKTFNTSSLRNPCHTYKDTGVYCIKQVVSTKRGCSDSVTKCLTVLPDFLIFVPNAFTPNNDIYNPEFGPKISGALPNDYEFVVYDRWGKLIFKTNTISEKWSGTVNGGNEIAAQGIYVWRIIVYDLLNKKHELRGRASLIR